MSNVKLLLDVILDVRSLADSFSRIGMHKRDFPANKES